MLHIHLDDEDEDDFISCATYIVRYQPSFWQLPHHTHAKGEEYVVLRGSFHDDGLLQPTLSWTMCPPGSDHYAMPDDCDVLTWRGQMFPQHYKPKPMTWWKEGITTNQTKSLAFTSPHGDRNSDWELAPFGYILRLLACEGGEETHVEHWFPDMDYDQLVPKNGLERFVLSGSIIEDGEVHLAGAYVRNVVEGEMTTRQSGPDGCTVLVKSGHLSFIHDAKATMKFRGNPNAQTSLEQSIVRSSL